MERTNLTKLCLDLHMHSAACVCVDTVHPTIIINENEIEKRLRIQRIERCIENCQRNGYRKFPKTRERKTHLNTRSIQYPKQTQPEKNFTMYYSQDVKNTKQRHNINSCKRVKLQRPNIRSLHDTFQSLKIIANCLSQGLYCSEKTP